MSYRRYGMSLVVTVGVVAAALAAATIWLVLTDPVSLADAVSERDVTPFVSELAAVIFEAIRGLLRYL